MRPRCASRPQCVRSVSVPRVLYRAPVEGCASTDLKCIVSIDGAFYQVLAARRGVSVVLSTG